MIESRKRTSSIMKQDEKKSQTELPKLCESQSLIPQQLQHQRQQRSIEIKKKNQNASNDEYKVYNIIPRNLTVTQEDLQQFRHLDQRRWLCLSRPQYRRSCGISSLVSCFNYLFSWLGAGNLPPISQEEAMIKLGICKEKTEKHFNEIEFGSFSGNSSLQKWFRQLCKIYKQEGRAFIMWKMHGSGRTQGVDEELALEKLKDGLRTETNTYIYHAFDHYFCPVGYEITPLKQHDAYKKITEIDKADLENWIFIGEPSKCYPCFQIKRWREIVKDISLANPFYYDIRKPERGIQERKNQKFRTGKKVGKSLHCIMCFQKITKKHQQNILQINKEEVIKINNNQTVIPPFAHTFNSINEHLQLQSDQDDYEDDDDEEDYSEFVDDEEKK